VSGIHLFAAAEYFYEFILCVVFLCLNCVAISLLARSRWRYHVRWLVPLAVANSLDVLYCVIRGVLSFRRGTSTPVAEIGAALIEDLALVLGLASIILLFLGIRQAVRNSSLSNTLASEDVWPPPPSGNSRYE
jgi:hypothetical protein